MWESFMKIDFFVVLRAIWGVFYVCFLPGFLTSLIAFPTSNLASMTWVDRIILSILASIAEVSIIIFAVHRLGIFMNLTVVSIVIFLFLLFESFVLILIQRKNYK